MIEIKSNHSSAKAKIFTDTLDKETKKQIAALLRMPAYADSKIRVMPDTHAGRGCVIGMTMTLSGRVSPSLVGVDIGCGMEVVELAEKNIDLPRLDAFIHEHIPAGKHLYGAPLPGGEAFPLDTLRCISADVLDVDRVRRSLGTLGGGNHFIEVDKAPDGRLYLVIHSGSRSLGAAVANHYREEAYRRECQKARRNLRAETHDCRDEERDPYDIARFGVDTFGDIPNRPGHAPLTKAARRDSKSRLPVKWENSVCEGKLYEDYLHDQLMVVRFAEDNRRTIADRICRGLRLTVTDRFSCVHNYIDENGILRKGAISARLGERVFIPLNMRDGALMGRGLGNPDWNFSAPHGAGRACSRTDARHAYRVEDYQTTMAEAGIYTTTAVRETLDECPMAYKSPDRILPYLVDCVEVEAQLRPIYNFKAAESYGGYENTL